MHIFCANQETTDTNLQGIKETSVIVSCNRSITQHLAAIFQIIFAAKELYDARGTQVDRYGYAAYSFTVTPYLLMSFLNLLAMICQPQYPTLYLVELNKPPGSQNTATDPEKPEGRSTDQQKAVTGAIGTVFLSRQHQSMSSQLNPLFHIIVGYSVSPY